MFQDFNLLSGLTAAENVGVPIESLLADARGRARVIERRSTDLVRLVATAIEALQPLAATNGVTLAGPTGGTIRAGIDPGDQNESSTATGSTTPPTVVRG